MALTGQAAGHEGGLRLHHDQQAERDAVRWRHLEPDGARFQHRNGTGAGFCREHGLTRLVHVEQHPTIGEAIAREKALKAWHRGWKLNLIGRTNPEWRDLYLELNA